MRRLLAAGIAFVLISFPIAVARAAEPGPAAPAGPPAADGAVLIPISVLFGNVEIGQPAARVAETGELLGFVGPEIIELMRPVVLPSVVAALEAQRTAKGMLPVSAFRKAGLMAEYDPSRLALTIFVPFDLRTPGAVSIAARRPPLGNVALKPVADASGYVNLRVADDYISRGGDDPGRQPAVFDFEGAVRLFGAALEGSATYRERSSDPWSRGDVRLVKDFPEDMNRLTFGDLDYDTAGFQSFEQAGGVSFARNFDLQPYHVKSSTAERTFTLSRRSELDVIVNGRLVRTITLEPGRYNLRDLPLASGTNDVTVRITDDVGRTETIRFPFVFDTNLLAAGEHEFSYAIGARSISNARGKDYDTADPLFSAFHSVGVNDYLTLGANLQALDRHRVIGTEARIGTVIGIFRGDIAVSESSYAQTDMAARLQYRFTEPQTPHSLSRNVLASLTWRGESFVPLGTTEPSNAVALDTGVVYGQKLPRDWFGSVGLSVQFNRSGDPDTRTFDATLSRRLTDDIHLDIFGRREVRPGVETETSMFVTISWIPFQSRHRMTVQRDTGNRSTRFDWSYTPTETLGDVQAYVSAERLPDLGQDQVGGNLTYVDYRYEAQLRHDEVLARDSSETRRTTGLRLGTALVFADGQVAVSRPVSDSFIMVAPHPTLKDHEVQVNRVTERPQARTDALGPAVLPTLPSYHVQRVTVDVPDLPRGYDLGESIFNVQPAYRSGTLITVGTGATASVEGMLVDPLGRVIDLQVGTVVSMDAPEREPKGFFTDAEGRFQLTGLVPGRYELRLKGAPQAYIRFSVPEGAAGVHGLGIIVFPTEARQ